MFEIAYDHGHRVVWASFSGFFTRGDLAVLDEVGRVVTEAAGPLDSVFEFSSVQGNEVRTDDMIQRGQQLRLAADKRRIIVGTQPALLRLAQVFVATQVMTGSTQPSVVHTAAEARGLLGLETLELKVVALDALRKRLGVEPRPGPPVARGG